MFKYTLESLEMHAFYLYSLVSYRILSKQKLCKYWSFLSFFFFFLFAMFINAGTWLLICVTHFPLVKALRSNYRNFFAIIEFLNDKDYEA